MNDTVTEIELKFIKEDDEVLHSPAQPWSSDLGIDPENLVKEMLSIMLVNNGIGLAAPQVGLPISVFVMGNAESSYACFNPRVISVSSERAQTQEGCLSYPGLYLNIKRPTSVVAEYEDVKGETHRKEFTGILATVFLHEFDHLHGICFIDRASELSVKLAKQRVRKNLKKQGIK